MSEPTADNLRDRAEWHGPGRDPIACRDAYLLDWAADRIDELEQALHAEFDICNSLRAENERLRQGRDELERDHSELIDGYALLAKDFAELRAENERLMDVLERELTIGEDR